MGILVILWHSPPPRALSETEFNELGKIDLTALGS